LSLSYSVFQIFTKIKVRKKYIHGAQKIGTDLAAHLLHVMVVVRVLGRLLHVRLASINHVKVGHHTRGMVL